ncbi:MAG: hypothetical protein IPG68_01140 [Micrococcales bacterium]|nr:hypothetical protein [Micrococcales bacterium]
MRSLVTRGVHPYYFPPTDGTDSVSQGLMPVGCSVPATEVDVVASSFTPETPNGSTT